MWMIIPKPTATNAYVLPVTTPFAVSWAKLVVVRGVSTSAAIRSSQLFTPPGLGAVVGPVGRPGSAGPPADYWVRLTPSSAGPHHWSPGRWPRPAAWAPG